MSKGMNTFITDNSAGLFERKCEPVHNDVNCTVVSLLSLVFLLIFLLLFFLLY